MTSKVKVTIHPEEVRRHLKKIQEAAEVGLRRVTLRGEQLVREEVPKETHNLEHGVSSDFNVAPNGMARGEVIISARTGRRGNRQATLHTAGGKTKTVSLRAQASFNYAEVVKTGRPAIRPRRAKALLIPVPKASLRPGQSHIESGGETFIVRPEAKAVKPNRYDERAGRRLASEARPIFDRALKDVLD